MTPGHLSPLSVLGEKKATWPGALSGLFPPTLQPLSPHPIHTGLRVSLITGLASSCLRAFAHTVPAALNVLPSGVHMPEPPLYLLITAPQSSHPHNPPSYFMIYVLCDSVSVTNSLVSLFGDFNIL